MKSIMQKDKFCYYCGTCQSLQLHHIYFGSLRKISDENGFTCWLCMQHHTGSKQSPHHNREIDLALKKLCQKAYERTHSRAEFMKLIGRNYLDEDSN